MHAAECEHAGRSWRWTRRVLLVLAGLLVMSAFVWPGARAPPPIPMVVRGHALDFAGAPLPVGTPVRAFLDGVVYSNASEVLDATGAFSLRIDGNWMLNATTPDTPTVKEGADLGERVQIAAGDFTGPTRVFQEDFTWSPAGSVTMDLRVGSSTAAPAEIKLQGLVPQPARGGNPYVVLCNPTAAPVSLFDYYLQVDRPGTYFGPNATLSGSLAAGGTAQVNLSSPSSLTATGDAVKLVYRNPGGGGAPAGGQDVVVDRVEYNASAGGTLDWEPGNTIMGDTRAPGIGQILQRAAACSDTNGPSDFEPAREPGLPPDLGAQITITAPAVGAIVQGGTTFAIRWTLSHDFFPAGVLKVWVNVTFGGASHPVLAAAAGATNVDWPAPDFQDEAASVRVDVVDPFGVATSSNVTFRLVRPQPYAVVIAGIIIGVIVAFVLLGLWVSRRRARKETPPPTTAPPPGAVPPPTVAQAPAPAATKTCPRCHAVVRAEDVTCFYCGYLFVRPP